MSLEWMILIGLLSVSDAITYATRVSHLTQHKIDRSIKTFIDTQEVVSRYF